MSVWRTQNLGIESNDIYVSDPSTVDELNNVKFRLAHNNQKNFSLAQNICDSVTRLTQMYP